MEHAELSGDSRTLALAIEAKDDELFDRARTLLRVAAEASDSFVAARAKAHLCHIEYYDGHFERGAQRALELVHSSVGHARAEASLYASVNLIALNRVDDALVLVRSAGATAGHLSDPVARRELRLRVSRQLVHVLVASGDYVLAAAEAETAGAIARQQQTARSIALAAYLRGYVRAALGDSSAILYLQECERWAGARPLGDWVRHVMAVALRDFGDVGRAMVLHDATHVRLKWEEPLFDLAAGWPPVAPDADSGPEDERPFRQAIQGVLLFLAGAPSAAIRPLASAAAEFARLRLEHYRRGASLALVAAHAAQGDVGVAVQGLRAELPAIERARMCRWPWWHRRIANALVTLARSPGVGLRSSALEASEHRSALKLDDVLRSQNLSEREAEVVQEWIGHPAWRRSVLASALGLSESAVRQHMNNARRKLRCFHRRGPDALRARLEELARPLSLHRN